MQYKAPHILSTLCLLSLLLGLLCPSTAEAAYAYITNYDLNTVSVVDTQTHATVGSQISVGTEPTGVAVTPDGSRVWVANSNYSHGHYGSISVIDTISNSVVGTISITAGNPVAVAISPDGTTAYVTTDNGCSSTCPVDVINTSTYAISTIQVSNQPNGVAFTPNGQKAYVAWDNGGSANGGVAVISTTTACGSTPAPCVLGNVTAQYGPIGVSVSPDGNTVYVANQNSHSVSYFSTSTTSGTANNVSLGSSAWPQSVAFSPDSSTVYVSDYDNSVVYYFAANTTSPGINSISVGDYPDGVNLVPYNTFDAPNAYGSLYVSTEQGLWIINPAINEVIDSVSISDSGPSFGAFVTPPSADSISFVTNESSNNVSAIDNATGDALSTSPISVGTTPFGAAVSPDLSTVLITNSNSNSVSVIDDLFSSPGVSYTLGTGFGFDQPMGVAFTPDGTTAYVANEGNNKVSVIDMTTAPPTLKTTISSSQFVDPYGVAVTPNGTTVYVTNHGNSSVSVIPTSTNTPTTGTGYPIGVGSSPAGIAVSPDDSYVYVANYGSGSNNVSKIAVGSTSPTTITSSSFDEPYAVAITPNSSRVYVTNYGSGTVSMIAGGTVTTPFGGSYPQGIAVNSDGTRAYFADNNTSGSLSAAATANNTVIDTFSVGGNPQAFGKFLARVPYPFYAYVTNQSSDNVQVIDTITGDTVTTITTGTAPIGSAISPNGEWVLVTNYGSNSITVINAAGGTPTFSNTISLGSGSEPIGVAFTPDNTWAYVTNQGNNTVSVIDLTSSPHPSLYTTITNSGGGQGQFSQPVGVAVTPDGTKAYVTNYGNQTVSVIDTSINGVITGTGYPYSVKTQPAGVAVTPDGKYAYVANEGDNSLSKITVGSNATPARITNSNLNGPFGLAITPDGTTVYITNNGSGTVSVMTNGTFTNLLNADYPYGIAVSPDGTRAYFANDVSSGTLSVVDTATNAIISNISVGSHPQAFGMFVGR